MLARRRRKIFTIYALKMLEKPCFSCICALKILKFFPACGRQNKGGPLFWCRFYDFEFVKCIQYPPPWGGGGLGQNLRFFDYKNRNLRFFGCMPWCDFSLICKSVYLWKKIRKSRVFIDFPKISSSVFALRDFFLKKHKENISTSQSPKTTILNKNICFFAKTPPKTWWKKPIFFVKKSRFVWFYNLKSIVFFWKKKHFFKFTPKESQQNCAEKIDDRQNAWVFLKSIAANLQK